MVGISKLFLIRINPEFWAIDPNRPNLQEMRFDSPLKKAAVCFRDRK